MHVGRERGLCGYLSIFMSLSLTLVLSLCLVLIEAARQNTIRLESECIVDMGMNSVLAEYHREVLDRYNLFFIDCSYGTPYPSYYNTEDHLEQYLHKNVALQEELGILADNGLFRSIYMDPLKISFPEVTVTRVSLATDNQGYQFQQQAIQAVKSDVGIKAVETVTEWLHVVEQHNLLDNTVEQKIEAAEQQLQSLQGKQQLEDKTWVTIEVENPLSYITEERRKGLLYWVMENLEELSAKVINPQQYVSVRRKKQQLNQGNIPVKEGLSLYERLLFQEYLVRYAANYLEGKEDTRLDYQMEYVLFGTDSDTDNMRKTAAAICGMREAANLLYLMGDPEKQELISAAASALSAVIFVPEAAPVFESILLIGWSCLESIQDTKNLLKGEKVPLLKTKESWRCSLESLFGGEDREVQGEDGLSYSDYLRLFLCFADLEEITYRFMDVMEMEIRETTGNENFRMDGCVDYLEVQVKAVSAYGYTYELQHAKGYR